MAAHPGALAEQRRLPADRRHQPEVIEHRRPQRRGQLAQRGDADVGQPGRGLQAIDDRAHRRRRRLAELGDRRAQLEPDAREQLAELVVQRPRELAALLLARAFGKRRELAQAAARLAQPPLQMPRCVTSR